MTPKKYVEVAVKVPERLMRLIEATKYFGRSRDKFFCDCIRRGVCCDMNDLDTDKEQRLERKYQVESELIVYPDQTTL